ncbi:lipase family protein [Rubripirellula reticaptiva]|uniref:Glutamyl endopeptidase n=1 Tax=Rubripirellula reticaptiva TaxID=2528013 RepID=A0A5C6EMU0_9BACT|nr:trypsin-like peptidase domain-containing protein [Rubripirellula reticaptiva]TWU49467.1 Glutamyl endopeptidase precursor [Rubripirellula reticaptiva]
MAKNKLTDQERENRLRKLLGNIAPEGALGNLKETLESTSPMAGEATESLDNLTLGGPNASDEQIAVESLDVLIQDPGEGVLRPDQLFGLEAIVHKRFRPAEFILNNSFKNLPHPWTHLGNGDSRTAIETACRSIGRIEVPGHPSLPYAGTGFLVGTNLLMTNRHVAAIFCRGLGRKHVKIITGMNVQIDFLEEHLNPEEFVLEVDGVELIHPYWDMALLRVKQLPEGVVPLTLSTARPEAFENQDVVVVGYPAMDPRNDITLQNQIFHGVYDVKRLQPGKLLTRQEVGSFGKLVNALTHDCSTLGGNSGSALLHIPSGQIIGLHFAGIYLKENYAVPTFDLASDQNVVQAGVNFAPGDVPLSNDYLQFWNDADSEIAESSGTSSGRLNASTTTGSSPQTPSLQSPPPHGGAGNNDSPLSFEWTQPLHFSVRLGNPVAGHPAPSMIASLSPTNASVPTSEGRFRSQQTSDNELAGEFDSLSLLADGDAIAAAYSTAFCSQLAYESPAVVDRVARRWNFQFCRSIHVGDTQCFFASNENVNLIAFRGTESLADWLTDLKILSIQRTYGRVHRGFVGAFQDVESQLLELIELNPGKRLVITGHSLGGALAVVAAAEWSGRINVNSVFTFGQPAVGKGNFVPFMTNQYGERHLRVVNDDDIVAMVPPTFVHTGRLLHMRNGVQIESLALGHSATDEVEPSGEAVNDPPTMSEEKFGTLQDQLRVAKAMTPTTDIAEEGPLHAEGLLPSFRDHKMANYIAGLKRLMRGTNGQ